VLVLAVLLPAALAGCAKSSADTFSGAVLHAPYHAPATELTDTDGKPFSLSGSTDKRLTLVFFGYTHCPDECPTTMATLASAMLQLDDADRSNVQVVFVTTDPARDTGSVIRGWLDHFDSHFVGATGPLPTIKKVAERRTNRVLKDLSLLKNTANPGSYSSTEEQRATIISALRDGVDQLEAAYAGGKKEIPTVTL